MKIKHYVTVAVTLRFTGDAENVQKALDRALMVCNTIVLEHPCAYDPTKGPRIVNHTIVQEQE